MVEVPFWLDLSLHLCHPWQNVPLYSLTEGRVVSCVFQRGGQLALPQSFGCIDTFFSTGPK